MRLAGAQNLDIKMARERLAEAKANHGVAVAQFFPWFSAGVSYKQHDDKLQDVEGNIIGVHKYSYAPGASLAAQVDLGDALYKSLASRQLVEAASHGVGAQPDLKQSQAVLSAARHAKTGATYGPLIPSLGGQAFFGGLGGGRDGISDTFGPQEDYSLSASWRIGPGGLFDFTRIHAAESRLKIEELALEKLRDEVTRQVVEAFTHWQSAGDQLEVSRRALGAAEEALKLARQRREFAGGIVLENIHAEEDLTRARLDYLKVVAAFNEAQFALRRATGKL